MPHEETTSYKITIKNKEKRKTESNTEKPLQSLLNPVLFNSYIRNLENRIKSMVTVYCL